MLGPGNGSAAELFFGMEFRGKTKQTERKKKKPTKQGLEISIHHCSELLLSTRQEGAAAPLPCTPPGPRQLSGSY